MSKRGMKISLGQLVDWSHLQVVKKSESVVPEVRTSNEKPNLLVLGNPAAIMPSTPMMSANNDLEIEFGFYPQGPRGQIKPIRWVVLEQSPSRQLVISKYCLDSLAFDDCGNDWQNAELNYWLNTDFIKRSFTPQEQKRLVTPVGILSVKQVRKYLKSEASRQGYPTEYLSRKLGQKIKNTCRWWLQTPGCWDDYAAVIAKDGGIYNDGIDVMSEETAVRPVLCIKTEYNSPLTPLH